MSCFFNTWGSCTRIVVRTTSMNCIFLLVIYMQWCHGFSTSRPPGAESDFSDGTHKRKSGESNNQTAGPRGGKHEIQILSLDDPSTDSPSEDASDSDSDGPGQRLQTRMMMCCVDVHVDLPSSKHQHSPQWVQYPSHAPYYFPPPPPHHTHYGHPGALYPYPYPPPPMPPPHPRPPSPVKPPTSSTTLSHGGVTIDISGPTTKKVTREVSQLINKVMTKSPASGSNRRFRCYTSFNLFSIIKQIWKNNRKRNVHCK